MDIAAETDRAFQAFAQRDYAGAAERARRILRQAPDDPAALTLFGRLALNSREPDVARQLFERVLQVAPPVAATWIDVAQALVDLRRDGEAIEALQRALAMNPGNVDALVKLGEVQLSIGARANAAETFRRALELDGARVPAYRGLCLAEDIDPGSPPALRMAKMAAAPGLPAADCALLHYSLAQVNRRADRDEQFIEHLLAANEKQRAAQPATKSDYQVLFDRLEAALASQDLPRAPRADPCEPVPIFVLGMPRSGTTLVEQLVAASPGVVAGGELHYVRGPLRRAVEQLSGQAFPLGFAALSVERLNALAVAFANRLKLLGGGSPYVTDKTPDNFHVLGLLRILFPGGPVVHVRRDPMDTCFSILQQPFDDRSSHACDMELLGYAYARYVRLMRLWQQSFEGEFITVDYERLVASPADEARRIFDFCRIEWQDSFLESHRSGGAVRTFSVTQVRQPIYRSSIGAWQRYARALEPLRRSLESELENP